MRKSNALFIAGAFMLAFSGCDSFKSATDEATGQTEAETVNQATLPDDLKPAVPTMLEKDGLKLTSFDDSPKFASAGLRVIEPVNTMNIPTGPVPFVYDITNFELTKMTGHDHSKEMANSEKGQHIHNIIDNQPYTAHYETKFTKDVPEGNHVVLSFLSRSYHESLKHPAAHDLRTFTVGKPGTSNTFDLKAQHLFYSRPKGEYVGDDAKKVMLDFYLVNTTLAPEGNKVKATINGTEFMLDRWLPYMIEGMPMGENKIKLELVDASGNVIPGPYNTVERTITLKAS